MIKKVTKFVDTEYKWSDHDELDEAKEAAKRRLIQKFVTSDVRSPDEGWRYAWTFSTKVREAKKEGFKDGWYSGQYETERRLLKFLPEITAGLKAIEEQPIEEVKND